MKSNATAATCQPLSETTPCSTDTTIVAQHQGSVQPYTEALDRLGLTLGAPRNLPAFMTGLLMGQSGTDATYYFQAVSATVDGKIGGEGVAIKASGLPGWLATLEGPDCVFFTPHPVKSAIKMGTPITRPSAKQMAKESHVLTLDLDKEHDLGLVLSRAEAAGIRPCLVTASGSPGCYHVYFSLDDPSQYGAWAEHFRGLCDPSSFDAHQLLGFPGSKNRKVKKGETVVDADRAVIAWADPLSAFIDSEAWGKLGLRDRVGDEAWRALEELYGLSDGRYRWLVTDGGLTRLSKLLGDAGGLRAAAIDQAVTQYLSEYREGALGDLWGRIKADYKPATKTKAATKLKTETAGEGSWDDVGPDWDFVLYTEGDPLALVQTPSLTDGEFTELHRHMVELLQTSVMGKHVALVDGTIKLLKPAQQFFREEVVACLAKGSRSLDRPLPGEIHAIFKDFPTQGIHCSKAGAEREIMQIVGCGASEASRLRELVLDPLPPYRPEQEWAKEVLGAYAEVLGLEHDGTLDGLKAAIGAAETPEINLDAWYRLAADGMGLTQEEAETARYYFQALLGRAIQPGCSYRLMLILQGCQGSGKTVFARNFRQIYGSSGVVDLDPGAFEPHNSDRLKRKLAPAGLALLDEFDKISQNARLAANLKSVISESFLDYDRKYQSNGRAWAGYGFIGTTNLANPLPKDTANDRYYVVKFGGTWPDKDTDNEGWEAARAKAYQAQQTYFMPAMEALLIDLVASAQLSGHRSVEVPAQLMAKVREANQGLTQRTGFEEIVEEAAELIRASDLAQFWIPKNELTGAINALCKARGVQPERWENEIERVMGGYFEIPEGARPRIRMQGTLMNVRKLKGAKGLKLDAYCKDGTKATQLMESYRFLLEKALGLPSTLEANTLPIQGMAERIRLESAL